MKNKKGFTILELMVAITTFLIVMTSLLMLFQNAKKNKLSAELKAETLQNARAALDIISKELRLVGFRNDQNTNFVLADNDTVIYKADLDPTLPGLETISYYVGKNSPDPLTPNPNDYPLLKKISYVVNGVTTTRVDTIAYGLKSNGLSFKYYNARGQELTQPIDTNLYPSIMNVLVTVNTISSTVLTPGRYLESTLSTSVGPRNINLFGTGNDLCSPGQPTNFNATGGVCSATFSWTAPTTNDSSDPDCPNSTLLDYAGVRLYYWTAGSDLMDYYIDKTEGTTKTIELPPNTYNAKIVAVDLSGNESAETAVRTFTVTTASLAAPTNLTYTFDPNQGIVLNWTHSTQVSSPYFSYYEVWVSGGYDGQSIYTTSAGNNNSFLLPISNWCFNYNIKVATVSTCGNVKNYSSQININTLLMSPPAPTAFSAGYDPNTNKIQATWAKPANSFLLSGYILRFTKQNGSFSSGDIFIDNPNTTSYLYTPPVNICETWNVTIKSVSLCNAGTYSNVLTKAVLLPEEGNLPAPDITVTRNPDPSTNTLGILHMNWTSGSINDIQNYVIAFDTEEHANFSDYNGQIIYNGNIVTSPLTVNALSVGYDLLFSVVNSCEKIYFAIRTQRGCTMSTGFKKSNNYALYSECCPPEGWVVGTNNFNGNRKNSSTASGNVVLLNTGSAPLPSPEFDPGQKINKIQVSMVGPGYATGVWDKSWLAKNFQVTGEQGQPQVHGEVIYTGSNANNNVSGMHFHNGPNYDPTIAIPKFNSLADFNAYYADYANRLKAQGCQVIYSNTIINQDYLFRAIDDSVLQRGWDLTKPILFVTTVPQFDFLFYKDLDGRPAGPALYDQDTKNRKFKITIVAPKATFQWRQNDNNYMNQQMSNDQVLAFVSYEQLKVVCGGRNSPYSFNGILYGNKGITYMWEQHAVKFHMSGAVVTPEVLDVGGSDHPGVDPHYFAQGTQFWKYDWVTTGNLIGLPEVVTSIPNQKLINFTFNGNTYNALLPIRPPVAINVNETCIEYNRTYPISLTMDSNFGNIQSIVLTFYYNNTQVGNSIIPILP